MNTFNKITGCEFWSVDLQIRIHQPTIKEISLIGEETLFQALAMINSANKDFYIEQELFRTPEDMRDAKRVELGYKKIEDIMIFNEILGLPDVDPRNINLLYIKQLFALVMPDLKDFKLSDNTNLTLILRDPVLKDSDTYLEIDNENLIFIKHLFSFLFSTGESEDETDLNPTEGFASSIAKKIEEARKKRQKIYHGGDNNEKDDKSVLGTAISLYSALSNISIPEVLNLTFPQLFIQLNRVELLAQYNNQIMLGMMGGLDPEDLPDWRYSI